MLTIVLRKMMRNRWMVFCLLIGSVLAVAIVSSIPVYTGAILQRMLTRDLENDQAVSNTYPGYYQIKMDFSFVKEGFKNEYFTKFDSIIENNVKEGIGLPYISSAKCLTIRSVSCMPEIAAEKESVRDVNVEALSKFEDHISIIDGRMYTGEKTDGAYEAVISEGAMKELDLYVGDIYDVKEYGDNPKLNIKIKVVGVYTVKDPKDAYWFDGIYAYDKSMMIDYDLFYNDFIKTGSDVLSKVQWYYALDYHKITTKNLAGIIEGYNSQAAFLDKYRGIAQFKMQAVPIIQKYSEREKDLKMTLWVLQVPIMLMLAFYIFMVSQLMIENEKNEIAVLRSRGASGLQIFMSYLLESLLLSVIAIIIGPLLGLLICKVLGASNGFLEFVQRSSLKTSLGLDSYVYALFAVGLFMVTMLIPAYLSSRTTIVQLKQKKGRMTSTSIWKKYFLDVVLLAISIYGLYDFKHGQKMLSLTGVKGSEISVNPLLFIISSLFILGAGLLLLRVFPYIVRLIFWIGRKKWSPVFYASFIQVGRSGGREQFLMLFIIITISIGIFNANSARTLNRNMEEKIRYSIGADMTIMAQWIDQATLAALSMMDENEVVTNIDVLPYEEPPYEVFSNLKGAENVTKVFRTQFGNMQVNGKSVSRVNVMGIEPDGFGKVAWFRNDLLPYHWYNYLNFLAESPTAVLVSSSFKDKYKVKEGDIIYISWNDQDYMECVIYGFVDYWPGFNPNQLGNDNKPMDLVVANLSYIQQKMVQEPYEVWVKKKPGATSADILKEIENGKVNIDKVSDATQEIVKMKNDPMLQGTNGALTMGFVVTMGISMIGFLIYWVLSIHMRALQFGIFRAMGLSLKKVIGMLVCEQVLISGVAILFGIVVGGLTSDYFVPILQITSSTVQQVPPFKIVASRQDYVRLYIVVATMMAVGMAVLWRIIARIKISQALKLGED